MEFERTVLISLKIIQVSHMSLQPNATRCILRPALSQHKLIIHVQSVSLIVCILASPYRLFNNLSRILRLVAPIRLNEPPL